MAILTALTAHGANMAIGRRTVEALTQQFAMDIQYAKSQAVVQHRNIAIGFTNTSGSAPACYTLYFGLTGECTCQGFGNTICTGDGVMLKTVVIPTEHKISMRSNIETMQIEYGRGLVTPTGSIVIESVDGPSLKQIVNIVGRVRTCALSDATSGYPLC